MWETAWALTATEQTVEKKLLVPWALWHKQDTHSSVPSGLAGQAGFAFWEVFPTWSPSAESAHIRQGSYVPEETNHGVVFTFQQLRWNHNLRSGVQLYDAFLLSGWLFGVTFLNGKIHLWCGKVKEKPQSQITTDNHYFFNYEPRLTLANFRHLMKVPTSLYRKWISLCRETDSNGVSHLSSSTKALEVEGLKAGRRHQAALSSRSDLQCSWEICFIPASLSGAGSSCKQINPKLKTQRNTRKEQHAAPSALLAVLPHFFFFPLLLGV